MKDNALYLEADEDITSAIDKLQKTAAGVVQIVVPKRSTMLQSIINLKLLKKAAETSGKELVLVTNDRIATDLAARVGLAVAPSLGAKATVTEVEVPKGLKNNEEIIEADDPEPETDSQPARPAPVKTTASKRPFLKRRDVSDAPLTPAAASTAPVSGADPVVATGANENKTPKVPNFRRLQRRLLWVVAAVVLVGGYAAGMYLMTTAKVTLYVNGSKISIDTTFAVDPNLKSTDMSKAILAGQTVTVTKDLTGAFTPTGKKDIGTKASGAMTIYNEYDTSSHTLVAGTRLVAPDGKVFRTRNETTVPGATVSLSGGKITLNPGKSDPITVDADQVGDSYNEAPARYTIAGYSGDQQAKIYGQGAQMSGGTTRTVTVVTAADVDAAKSTLLEKDKDNVSRDLSARIPNGYIELPSSQATSVGTVTSTPAIDAEGATANLSLKVTYTTLATKKSEYESLIRAQELEQIGSQNQIYEDGIDNAQVTAGTKDSAGRQTFRLTTEAYGGQKLDATEIARKLKGQRYGDAARTASGQPGVTRADISLWPGWATNLPSRPDKIKVTIQVAGNK